MNTPVLFEKVSYRIAERDIYSGDLVIMSSLIYYYPHTDLTKNELSENPLKETFKSAINESIGVVGNIIELAEVVIPKETHRPNLRQMKLWVDGNSAEEFQDAINNCIRELSNISKEEKYLSKLPVPFIINKSNTKNISVSFFNHLTIEASYEKHIFIVGLTKKNTLRTSLEILEWM